MRALSSPVSDAGLDPVATSVAGLYRQHHDWLRAWLGRRLGCTHSAADVAHDTFLRLLGAAGSPLPLREPRAYLVTTATRLMIDRARREKIERAYLDTCAVLQADAVAHSPEQLREAIDILVAIDALLEGMPEKVRRTFVLSRLDEMPQAEIALQLGVSVSMVKQYLARALLHCYRVVHGLPEAQRGLGEK